MQGPQPEFLDQFFQYIFGFFDYLLARPLQSAIPLGPGDWFFIIYTTIFVVIILFLFRRSRGGGRAIPEGVTRIIASTGDVSGGMAGVKKLKFIKTPGEALVFLKIEENAIQQALSAVDYFHTQGNIDEITKEKLSSVYQLRLDNVRGAIAKDEKLKEIVETSTAVDRARSDYLRKLAAMSGTAVEAEGAEGGPQAVGMPSAAVTEAASAAEVEAAPKAAPPTAGPPSGGPPSGGPPSGGPPGGGPPGGAVAAVAPAVTPEVTPEPPPSEGPPGEAVPSAGPPGGAPPLGGPPGGAPTAAAEAAKPAGKSSLQSEMLKEMERLKMLMGGD